MGFSRQEYWSGLPFPSPGHLPDPGVEPGSPTFQADALTSEPSRGNSQGNNHGKDSSVQSLSCVQLCDPMDCSKPGFRVHQHLPELAQTHVPRVGDAIQPSHPLSSPSPPAFNLSQHQGLFQGVSSSHQVAKVLEL